MQLVYNSFSQLATDSQSHSGTVVYSSPSVSIARHPWMKFRVDASGVCASFIRQVLFY